MRTSEIYTVDSSKGSGPGNTWDLQRSLDDSAELEPQLPPWVSTDEPLAHSDSTREACFLEGRKVSTPPVEQHSWGHGPTPLSLHPRSLKPGLHPPPSGQETSYRLPQESEQPSREGLDSDSRFPNNQPVRLAREWSSELAHPSQAALQSSLFILSRGAGTAGHPRKVICAEDGDQDKQGQRQTKGRERELLKMWLTDPIQRNKKRYCIEGTKINFYLFFKGEKNNLRN